MAIPRSTLYQVADDKLDGKLAQRLRAMRADDRSWRWIAVKLAPELGFRPSYETLRSWGDLLGIPDRTGPESEPDAAPEAALG